MGKAIVSTAIGAEGLPVQHNENIALADNPQEFARETIELLRNPTRRQQMGAAAHKMVSERYSWRSVADGFAEVLMRVAGKTGVSEERSPAIN